MIYKIKAVMNLVDATWTPEERKRVGEKRLSLEDAKKFFGELALRCRDCAYVIGAMADYEKHKILPKKHLPNRVCGTQISGTYNRLGPFNVDDYIPKWDDPSYTTKAGTTLMDYFNLKRDELKQLIIQHPQLVGKAKPKKTRN